MAKRYYNLEKETKEYLKACDNIGITNQTNTKNLNDCVIVRKSQNKDCSFLKRYPIIYDDSLVMWLDSNISSSYPSGGLLWADLSKYTNNGTLKNGTRFSNGDMIFDGIDDYVDLGNSSMLKPTNSITITQWAYSPNWGAAKVPISCTQAGGYEFYVGSSILSFYVYVNGSYQIATFDVTGMSGYHNITGSFDGRYTKLYFDGVLKNTKDVGSNYPIAYVANNVLIGAEAGDGASPQPDYYWSGRIPSTQIYNRALSVTEIMQNYTATKRRYGL